jgi:hypothetical protein
LATKKKSEEQLVRVAPLGELRAYTISEHELEKLEQGTPVGHLLTIGLCLLSAAVTIVATLFSTSLTGQTLTLFFCALLIFAIIGCICTYLGWRARVSTKELARQIRARMPDAPSVQQVLLDPPTDSLSGQSSPPSTSTTATTPGRSTAATGQKQA